ncbi:MAG: DNA-binding response regulator [Roseateles depolymerans]|uniref:DNA-binding response regulator n=1 Tax=Roseateles depolymerans TaxID=76731 RepID=A0A2W5DS84_9BURK|nr:MAG: DNA-binding response regulator [Roseateles depolymerans]
MNAAPLRTALVEDDAAYRAALASAVMGAPGLDFVGAACDVVDGLALLRRTRPDLLLVDLQLPGGTGLTLIQTAAQELPDCEVVVVSTLGEDDAVLAALAAGAVGYLLKQGSASRLVEQLEALREGGAPLSPVIARKLLQRLSPAGRGPLRAAAIAPRPASAGEVSLSERELEILQSIAMGYSFEEITRQLGLTLNTVATHVKRCYRKLQVHSKLQAVNEARRRGLVP